MRGKKRRAGKGDEDLQRRALTRLTRDERRGEERRAKEDHQKGARDGMNMPARRMLRLGKQKGRARARTGLMQGSSREGRQGNY